MAIWAKILDYVVETADALASVIEAVRTRLSGDPETRRNVAFSIAMIALSAKMAKADGIVTEDEIAAFREIFEIPEDEAKNVARLYNLAKRDVAGYRTYAEKLAELCAPGERDGILLQDIIDGLFHIAKADGVVHERELAFLADVAQIFGIDEDGFERIAARHLAKGRSDPYRVLGI